MQQADYKDRQRRVWGDKRIDALANSHITLLGTGGLGCTVAEQLVRGGIGEVTLIDKGIVDIPDLGRQVLYTTRDLGIPKVYAAREQLLAICPSLTVHAVYNDVVAHAQQGWGTSAGVVDCLDTFSARLAAAQFLADGVFWVHGGILRDYGQITTVTPSGGHRLEDIFCGAPEFEGPIPVIPQTCAVIGAMQSLTVFYNIWYERNLLTPDEYPSTLRGHMLFADLASGSVTRVPLSGSKK